MRLLRSRWAIFFLTIAVHGAGTRGHALAGTDTPSYVQLANGFSAHDLSGMFNLDAVRWTKFVYLGLLAAARAASPAHWMGLMVAVNVICSGIIAVLLVELARHACRTVAGPVFALVFYLACYEVFQWIHFDLTDLVFCAASLIPFYLVARPLIDRGKVVRWPALLLAVVVALFTRPPGVLLVPFVLFVVLVLMKRSVSAKVAAAVIFLVVAAALVVRTAAVYDPALWPFRFIKPKIVEFSKREKTGEVIYGRSESFRPSPHTPADHLVIVGDRFVRFFQITTSSFSRLHNAINLAYFVPLYALGAAGIFFAFRNGQGQKELVIAILMWIGMFAFLHALTSLDFDWRCRAPLMPHFILLAACGLDALALRRFPGAQESAR